MAWKDESLESDFQELPPGSRLAFRTLASTDEPLSTADLAEKTGYSRRTMRDAVNRLCQRDLVVRRHDVSNPRIQYYLVNESL